ncbi:MAG: DNA-3-methyladenine glycosylase family protein [Solirubrobacteraceae bacterium]
MAARIAEAAPGDLVELRQEVMPASTFRLPRRTGMDGMLRRRGGVLERLLHHDEDPVLVRVAQPSEDRVVFGARSATHAAAAYGIERMRFALGVDEDMRPFLRLFSGDPLIGRSLRRRPWLRVSRRPEPFEALAWAICEQLIEYERAAAIERRVVARLGRRWQAGDGAGAGLRDLPAASVIAGTAPALLQSFDLAGSRALTLIRAAREVARGSVDLHCAEHERGWRRLRAIPGIGPWTVEMLALHGQGRHDQLPAGDVGLLKLVGRMLGGGDPYARAEEWQVREFFAPYGDWAGLAAAHMLAL